MPSLSTVPSHFAWTELLAQEESMARTYQSSPTKLVGTRKVKRTGKTRRKEKLLLKYHWSHSTSRTTRAGCQPGNNHLQLEETEMESYLTFLLDLTQSTPSQVGTSHWNTLETYAYKLPALVSAGEMIIALTHGEDPSSSWKENW